MPSGRTAQSARTAIEATEVLGETVAEIAAKIAVAIGEATVAGSAVETWPNGRLTVLSAAIVQNAATAAKVAISDATDVADGIGSVVAVAAEVASAAASAVSAVSAGRIRTWMLDSIALPQ